MSLFSFLRKNKQEPTPGDSDFLSRAEEDSAAVRGRGRRKSGKQSKQENQPVDPVLPEKKRARRRLVGAVALVLAVIIGLPMVLDSEPKPLAEDIAIQIPSKDKPFGPARTGRQPMAPAGAKIATSASLDPKEEVMDTPVLVSVPEKPIANIVPKTTVAPNTKPKEPARSVDVVKAPSADKPVVHAAEKKEVRPEHKPIVARPADKPVEKVAEKSEAKSTEKSTEKSEDTARAKSILEAKPAIKDDKAIADKKPVRFTVQVAAFASAEKVSELQDKLKTAGINSYTQKVATQSGERIRIRVGPFASKEEADKVKSKLGSLGLNATLVPISL